MPLTPRGRRNPESAVADGGHIKRLRIKYGGKTVKETSVTLAVVPITRPTIEADKDVEEVAK